MNIRIDDLIQATHSDSMNQFHSDAVLNIEISNVVIDSRKANAGSLFIPLDGDNVSGYEFVEYAFKNGAEAVLWEKHRACPPSHFGPLIFVEDCVSALQDLAKYYLTVLDCKTIGITGSNGKTSTKDILFSLCKDEFKTYKTEGNLNNHLGLPLTILSAPEDTELLILEMGMSGFGEIDLLASIVQPDIAIITNIGESHIEFLGSREGIAKAKFEIVNHFSDENILIYDGDEPLLNSLVSEHPINALSYGFNNDNVAIVDLNENGLQPSFTIKEPFDLTAKSNLLGKHQVKNCTAAVLAASLLGVPKNSIIDSLTSVKLTPMRMEPIQLSNNLLVINDCYNASPTSMEAAIRFLGDYPTKSKKALIIGDMLELGSYTLSSHLSLYDILNDYKFDSIVFVGEQMEYLYNLFLLASASENEIPDIKHYFNTSDLLNDVDNFDWSDCMLLLKGSRGMRLDSLVSVLRNR